MNASMDLTLRVSSDVVLGKNARLFGFCNLYGCEIGDETTIGTFVEIQRGAEIGARCKMPGHSFIREGVTIEDGVFIGHGVTFVNDRYPRAVNPDGSLQTQNGWECQSTLLKRVSRSGLVPRF